MRDLALSQDARAARNAATIAQADTGGTPSTIRLYTSEGGTLLAQRTLAQPCASVRPADGRIQLAPDNAAADIVQATGIATWGQWHAGDGTLLAAGPVTDAAGHISDGQGGTTPTGDTGPWVLAGTSGTQLYEGGLVLLQSGLIG